MTHIEEQRDGEREVATERDRQTDRSAWHGRERRRRFGVHLFDVGQLQDVREDVEPRGLQQRADSLGQGGAWQRQELLRLHLGQDTPSNRFHVGSTDT